MEKTKLYLNIDAISRVILTPEEDGSFRDLYKVVLNNGGILVSKEDCQRILDVIQKYNRQ